MAEKKIKSALISVFDKTGLDEIVRLLDKEGITIYSTGGTQDFIESLGVKVLPVEGLTTYPSILDGRVKTLHPMIFGGILAIRNEDHLSQLRNYDIPEIDLVVVDLYPFEKTVAASNDEAAIIEKIDIGGIALIRGAAKNFNDVVVIPSKAEYGHLLDILKSGAKTDLSLRKSLAMKAFKVSSHYDTAIFTYFNRDGNEEVLKLSYDKGQTLRYGENPHQTGQYFGRMEDVFDVLGGKELSYNNLVDVDAAIGLMSEFSKNQPAVAILKHTNACGVAVRPKLVDAWKAALAGDPVSAFGGILITNTPVDIDTAREIDQIFYEVLIAPDFAPEAFEFLSAKSKRILLKLKDHPQRSKNFKSLLNGVVVQDNDTKTETTEDLKTVTTHLPNEKQKADLLFANKIAKHLKSNTIVFARDNQLLGMGCGQTSRVDACKQAIEKARSMGFDLKGSAMASDAFFPFPDCVQLGHEAGATSVVQPGGSIKDQLSIDYCNEHSMAMVFTGHRHFKH